MEQKNSGRTGQNSVLLDQADFFMIVFLGLTPLNAVLFKVPAGNPKAASRSGALVRLNHCTALAVFMRKIKTA